MTTEDILKDAARHLDQHCPPPDTDDFLDTLARITNPTSDIPPPDRSATGTRVAARTQSEL
ncbi:hypothetical protein GXW83_24460 [Streptacidiphilus sp. PB12-B1b]|uniref:hypothetical protein n=1 Tax=Streptacidiphilus sp. PB12-B1b TaxID=2705012 RepID=UPI0015FA290D|nr:hypothetical protein [Streptacidiphilus sp. PB12-B1b]QMU78391.1 hypothetical protein GXW83_24460 [Streptacidiphilus sp. PB12-B1b]